ncbi:MAG: orotate phosphoribosyltransferase [Halobacteriota archaeon]
MQEIVQDARSNLKHLIKEHGYFADGPYTLSAGGTSDCYFDLRRVTMDPRGADLISELMLERLKGVANIAAVGGMESGAIPIATAIALKSLECRSGELRAFFVRKTEKKHGRKRRAEGLIQEGDVVAFVEDVTTSGKSVLSGIAAVEQLGCTVAKVISVLDRENGAQELITKKGYQFEALFKASDFK